MFYLSVVLLALGCLLLIPVLLSLLVCIWFELWTKLQLQVYS